MVSGKSLFIRINYNTVQRHALGHRVPVRTRVESQESGASVVAVYARKPHYRCWSGGTYNVRVSRSLLSFVSRATTEYILAQYNIYLYFNIYKQKFLSLF